jgi:hypothetical protein
MQKTNEPIPFRPRKSGSAPSEDASPTASLPSSAPRPRGLPTAPGRPTDVQRLWLQRGLTQAGGKLPLFDSEGRRVDTRTVRACVERGWAEPWFHNPLKADWQVCRLTELGRSIIADS